MRACMRACECKLACKCEHVCVSVYVCARARVLYGCDARWIVSVSKNDVADAESLLVGSSPACHAAYERAVCNKRTNIRCTCG